MDTEHTSLTERDGVATLTLNRPERENAVDSEMMGAIIQALRQIREKGSARILLLRGAGEHFCAGREPGAHRPKNAAEWNGVLGQIVETNQQLAAFPGITLALVQGKAHGFGCGMAIQSDFTIAAADARFGFPEIKAGFPPTVVMSYLSRWVARKKAFEWVVTGEEIDAREAERFGLVNRVVARDEMAAEGERWVDMLMKKNPSALSACKAFFRDTAYLDPKDAARYGVSLLANFMASRDG
jgi:methylglutaconyl-CoA hydratase